MEPWHLFIVVGGKNAELTRNLETIDETAALQMPKSLHCYCLVSEAPGGILGGETILPNMGAAWPGLDDCNVVMSRWATLGSASTTAAVPTLLIPGAGTCTTQRD